MTTITVNGRSGPTAADVHTLSPTGLLAIVKRKKGYSIYHVTSGRLVPTAITWTGAQKWLPGAGYDSIFRLLRDAKKYMTALEAADILAPEKRPSDESLHRLKDFMVEYEEANR